MSKPIYMDYQATTPVDHRVLQGMLPYFSEVFGNPASRYHEYGWMADAAVEKARKQVGRLLGVEKTGGREKEIIFTSGATESNSLALRGVMEANAHRGKHLIVSAVEHSSVRDVARYLSENGYAVTFLPVDSQGTVVPATLEKHLRRDTVLVSVMAANNEIGTVNPVGDIGRICRERGVYFHTDAVQAAGKIPLNVQEMNIDLLSLSGHKMYGPKGVGALYIRRKNPRVQIAPLFYGGGHEDGLRSGTLNVPGIVGLGLAAEMSLENLTQESSRVAALRDRLWKGLQGGLDHLTLNGSVDHRLPGNLNVAFAGVHSEALMMNMKDVAVASGAACASAQNEPSYVLRAIGRDEKLAKGSIRFSLGRMTTEKEVDDVILRVVENVKILRKLSPDFP